MIRYALFASTLAHFLLIFGLNNLNLTENKAFELHKPDASVLQVRFAIMKQQQAMRFGNNINAAFTKVDNSQQTILGMQGNKVAEQARKQQSAANKMPLLLSGMSAPANLGKPEVSLNSYLKPADVDISAIPLHELRLNNDPPISLMAITWHLRVFIDQNGDVKQVVNLDEKHATASDDREVIARVEQMQFIPAKKNGVVVNSYMDVEIEITK